MGHDRSPLGAEDRGMACSHAITVSDEQAVAGIVGKYGDTGLESSS
jgi:hypothetical protein